MIPNLREIAPALGFVVFIVVWFAIVIILELRRVRRKP